MWYSFFLRFPCTIAKDADLGHQQMCFIFCNSCSPFLRTVLTYFPSAENRCTHLLSRTNRLLRPSVATLCAHSGEPWLGKTLLTSHFCSLVFTSKAATDPFNATTTKRTQSLFSIKRISCIPSNFEFSPDGSSFRETHLSSSLGGNSWQSSHFTGRSRVKPSLYSKLVDDIAHSRVGSKSTDE